MALVTYGGGPGKTVARVYLLNGYKFTGRISYVIVGIIVQAVKS